MISLIMMVCLQADAKICRQELIEFNGSSMACVFEAQPIVAEWGTDHPEWRIASWKCSRTG
ncbi:hypothetical protein [Hansschlegelia zhihuaiae]|uniref:Uncharacterized protein n=1 Tax=Hansschlegelia zhihuaiae TaxID=405005 RepID=A0A4Q0M8T7_9HYPH|nr:hypothetical protein [Hansschlegelia zhihuaiae]RXF69567.1 hypothetical protein EK403_18370 [Hansschlegelia zhihuaiae]